MPRESFFDLQIVEKFFCEIACLSHSMIDVEPLAEL